MGLNLTVKPQVIINIRKQQLQFIDRNDVVSEYLISTAKNGPGEINGSECTPRGQHVIRAKIGADALVNSIFVGRRLTGEVFSESLRLEYPTRDWILTRILWLSGLEPGINRLGSVDTMRRYIYIHGCPDKDVMGTPSSHGCIKMRNNDIVQFFDQVEVGTQVTIVEE